MKIEEALYILTGQGKIQVFEENRIESFNVTTGDVIRVKKSIHRLIR